MWATIAGVAIILAQAAQPLGPGSKGQEWCFDRGQGAQLCEATEAECNRLRGVNTEIAQSPCRHVEPPEIQQFADRTACAPQTGATDANPTIASGDIHAVTENVIVLDHHVADIDADAEAHPSPFWLVFIGS